jgi:preprotein translocase subunit SecE
VAETRSATQAQPPSAERREKRDRTERRSPLARLALFYRQVVGELRKVVWPTRHELATYTTVVIVFVTVIIAIVATLDYGISKAVTAVFG